MKKIAIVIFIILGCNIFIGKAQERGFQISGKIDGILEGTLFLMSDEKGKLEVLDTTSIMNGAFVFTGKVERPLSAYIMVPNSKNYIPLILENVNFMLNIGKTGVLIKGGEQQDILNQFSKINIDLLEGQNRIQEEFKQAQQKGDKKKDANFTETIRECFGECSSARKNVITEIFKFLCSCLCDFP